MVNYKKNEPKKIYLMLELSFNLFIMSFYKISGFEEKLVTNEYIEGIMKDTLYVLTHKTDVKIKIIFLKFYLTISNNNKNYEKIFSQNNIFLSGI